MAHANKTLLERLFTSLDRHDHKAMAGSYDSAAKFTDIAFDLKNGKEIHAMWHMICEGDIRATFDVVHADDHTAEVTSSMTTPSVQRGLCGFSR